MGSRFRGNGMDLVYASQIALPVQRSFISARSKSSLHHSLAMHDGEDVMERRHFLKLAAGFAAGAAAFAASAQAAPLAPHPLKEDGLPPSNENPRPAVTTAEEVGHLKPEEVRWHRRHWGWRRRHWGWRRRHWGWHRRRWHRRYWRRRYG
jgi:hypothetical protein